MTSFSRILRWQRLLVLLLVIHAPCNTAWATQDPLLDTAWSEARALATDWKIGDVKLQVRDGGDVFVATSASIVIGEQFLENIKAGPDAHDLLLFALLHELWHVHQIALKPEVYGEIAQRPVLECSADARAAYTMALQKHAVLNPDAAVSAGEAVAKALAAIPEIPARFPSVNDATAASVKHLGVDQRRFASLVGVLQALIADGERHPKVYPPGVYGRLLRQANELFMVAWKQGRSDQDSMADMCSYIANRGADKQVRVGQVSIESRQVEGKKRVVTRYEIENLQDRPITYSIILVDGIAEKIRSDRDMTGFTSMRRIAVDVPARGKGWFSTFPRWSAIDLAMKYLPAYAFGTLDRVSITGEIVPRPTCFDNAATATDSVLDLPMKTAIRLGQAAFGKFEGIRGEQDLPASNEAVKTFRFIFDAPDKSSGGVHYSSMFGGWSASFEIYKGDDKKEALKIIDRVEAYAKRYCPESEDPTFPIYRRDSKNGSLIIRRFTTGSSAELALLDPEPEEDGTEPEFTVYWSIQPAAIED
jgi:hypothetical protein